MLRVILNPGHGWSNASPGVYDTGAVSECGEEAATVAEITTRVVDRFWHDPSAAVTVIETPECGDACVARNHPKSSHLGYVVRWINATAMRGDVVISLHMNAAENDTASGTEVLYSHAAPKNKPVAADMSKAVAETLGLKDRGAKSSSDSARGHLAILDKTNPPAFLVELGFVTNRRDYDFVKANGVDAVFAAIEALRKSR